MEILVAKNAGFCFGVQNAIDKAESLETEGKNVFTLGPIIHNKHVVENLKSKGIDVINQIDNVQEDDKIIIRSHGISKDEYNALKEKSCEIIDATCPYVKHIHKIVEQKSGEGYKIIIIGDPEHPEVKGVNGWCNGNSVVVNSEEEIDSLGNGLSKICVVAQTTFNQEKWYSIVLKLVKVSKEILIFNTICNATELRQQETLELSRQVQAMIVIGGRESSNTRKLYEISKNNCENTFFIETADELDLNELKGVDKVGITAGASTPENIINEVIDKIKSLESSNVAGESMVEKEEKEEKEEREVQEEKVSEDKDMQDYFLDFKRVYPGMILEGKVIHVTNNEVYVGIGYKSDGILPVEEASHDEINLKEKFNVGDIIKVEVLEMNDGEGNVLLSRKSIEKQDYVNKLHQYKENGSVIEAAVTGVNKGGFECKYNDVRGFMPLSLSGVNRDEDNNTYVGKRLKVQIVDVKEKNDKVEITLSRKELVKEERQEKAKEFLEKIEYGQVCSGIVKSIINAGIFVNAGPVDIFVPVSELSWKRVNKPQDVISEGSRIDVLVIKINKEENKVTGSVKRLGKEPWEKFVESYREGDLIECKVARFTDFGVFVELIEGVDGLIHISNLADRRVQRPQEVVKMGQEIKARIIKIDNESKKVSLSLKDAAEVQQEQQ